MFDFIEMLSVYLCEDAAQEHLKVTSIAIVASKTLQEFSYIHKASITMTLFVYNSLLINLWQS